MARRLPPLNALRLFEAAGRHLSFKLAAEELHLTPSAVSHGIRGLEDWLGRPLFLRETRGLSLTQAGAAYLPEVRAALDRIALATATLPGGPGLAPLACSVAPTFGMRWLLPRLGGFSQHHPDVRLALCNDARMVDLAPGGFDVAIRMLPADGAGPRATPIAIEDLIPVCAPCLADAIRAPTDLAETTLLRVATVREDWDAWAALAGVDLPRRAGVMTFDRIDSALNAAAQGLGVAMGRLPLVGPDLESGRLVPVLGPPRRSRTGYWLLTGPGIETRPDVAAFRHWLAEQAAGRGDGEAPLPR